MQNWKLLQIFIRGAKLAAGKCAAAAALADPISHSCRPLKIKNYYTFLSALLC